MNAIESLILGVFQGFSEFLPISSSGHLVILQRLFNLTSDNIVFEVSVHFGTLLSVVAVYYSDLWKMIASFFSGLFSQNIRSNFRNNEYFRLAVFVVIATIPAGLVGVLFKDFIEGIFHSVRLVGVTLIVTGVLLFLTRFAKIQNRKLGGWNSLLIGLFQAFAILPGISRSGSTISAGLFSGISRMEAARFSFLLSVPAVLGATILEGKDVLAVGVAVLDWKILLIGLISSFIVGYLSLKFLLKIVQSGKFSWFAPYCLTVGLLTLLFL
ncbi:MAG: undecaprenyl-diphosphatase [Candidatus Marinimicrobia bacterium CG08_land_8_20_14_0_20_45_22]|nr:MAG: undecaprenyl-diphosphatase [Candidatus Marinimicrobia bacterium CG08_land_8_20_14_0_20_45_22]